MSEEELKKILNDAHWVSKRGNYLGALEICDNLLMKYTESTCHILRARSHIHAYHENIKEALSDRKKIISLGIGDIQDYYFAANYAIELQLFPTAIILLDDAVELSKETTETAYISDIYLLRAFSHLQVGEFLKARYDCNKIEDKSEILVEEYGFISKEELLRKIKKQELF